MIAYPPQLQQVVAARTGIAPAHLLDVIDPNGNAYYWASRAITAPAVATADNNPATVTYLPWILSVPQWKFYRSQQTDMGTVLLQNLSGDTLESDFEKIVTKTALDGSLFVYRRWHADAEYAGREVHGEMSVDDSDPETVQLICRALNNPSQDIMPRYLYSEICQWRWSSVQCGSTQPTPCQNSFPTCQVIERQLLIIDNFEKNFGETTSPTAANMRNRARAF